MPIEFPIYRILNILNETSITVCSPIVEEWKYGEQSISTQILKAITPNMYPEALEYIFINAIEKLEKFTNASISSIFTNKIIKKISIKAPFWCNHYNFLFSIRKLYENLNALPNREKFFECIPEKQKLAISLTLFSIARLDLQGYLKSRFETKIMEIEAMEKVAISTSIKEKIWNKISPKTFDYYSNAISTFICEKILAYISPDVLNQLQKELDTFGKIEDLFYSMFLSVSTLINMDEFEDPMREQENNILNDFSEDIMKALEDEGFTVHSYTP